MSYAVKKDGSGWRSIESEADLLEDETYSKTQPDPITADLALQVRVNRDALLTNSQWLIQRHRDQIEVSEPTTLTTDQYKALLKYRQDLRDVPTQTGFPDDIIFPKYPL